MPYDEAAAARVRSLLRRQRGFAEKKMFGGVSFLLSGHMCCGIVREDLCLRLGKEGAARALGRRHVRPMDFTGKPLESMIFVAPAGYATEAELQQWVGAAVDFVKTLPPK